LNKLTELQPRRRRISNQHQDNIKLQSCQKLAFV